MPEISVMIPVYNVEKYLPECLDSVLNQTFKDFEIICVNDGSSDGSADILKQYQKKDERISVINKDNEGISITRNICIEQTKGNYIYFLDSDDYMLPDTLQKLYDKIKQTGSDIVLIGAEAFPDEDTEETNRRAAEMQPYLKTEDFDNLQIDSSNFSEIIDNFNSLVWGKLYSKNFITENKLKFADKNVIHEDNGFWLKVCSCFPRISAMSDIGIMYRIRPKALTGEIYQTHCPQKSKDDMKVVLDDVFSYLQNNRIEHSKALIQQIKESKVYCRYFERTFSFIYRLRWGKNDKIISLFGLPFYRETIKNKNDKKVKLFRILGITVKKQNLK